MTERNVHALRVEALATLAEATKAANGAPAVESALGHLTAATQARHAYGPIDLDIFMCFVHVAAAVYMAHGGPEWLRTLVPRRSTFLDSPPYGRKLHVSQTHPGIESGV